MPALTNQAIPTKTMNIRDLETRLEPVRNRTRQRAYDLYCRRGNRGGTALDDWLLAERESQAVPLAGIAEEERDIRITACVPNASEMAVDVLPDEIVIEADHDGQIERFTRVRMPARIDANRVKARLCGTKLEVVAPKARE